MTIDSLANELRCLGLFQVPSLALSHAADKRLVLVVVNECDPNTALAAGLRTTQSALDIVKSRVFKAMQAHNILRPFIVHMPAAPTQDFNFRVQRKIGELQI